MAPSLREGKFWIQTCQTLFRIYFVSHSACAEGWENICRYVCIYRHIYTHWQNRPIGQVGRVFADDPGDRGSLPGRVIPKTQKWYLTPPCLTLSIIRYGSRLKSSNSGKESYLFLHLSVVAMEKGAFRSSSTKVANFTYIHIFMRIHKCICICIYAYMSLSLYIYIYVHIYLHDCKVVWLI